jgi:hypothetical protein
MKGIGMTGLEGFKYSVGIGYVMLPSDLDRDKYIADCYKNSYISIGLDDGGFLNRVPVSPEVLNFIEFPAETNQMGTPVVYVTDDLYQQPYIVSRFMRKDELGDNKESAFKFRRKVDDSYVEVSGSVQQRTLNLFLDTGDADGSINVKLFSKNKNSKLSFDVQGDVDVVSSGQVSTTTHSKAIIETIDNKSDDSARFEQSSTENKLFNKKIIINDGQDPLVLGNELKEFLGNFIDRVSEITVVTALGTQPIINKAQVLLLKENLNKILSTVAFIDK